MREGHMRRGGTTNTKLEKVGDAMEDRAEGEEKRDFYKRTKRKLS